MANPAKRNPSRAQPEPTPVVAIPRDPRVERYAALFGLFVLTMVSAWVYSRVFRGEPAGDDLTFHLAETTRISDCLRVGDFDLWNPSANAGYASAYYYQVIPQLVPAAMAAITGTQVLFWFQLCLFLPLVLAPVAAYRALRVWNASPLAALGGAIAVACCISNSRWGAGADGTFSVGLYTQTWSFAMFPLALAYGARWLDRGTSLGAATAWGLLVGLCHPFAGIALGFALGVGAVVPALVRRVVSPIDQRARNFFKTPASPIDDGSGTTVMRRSLRIALLGVLLLIGSMSAWLPTLVDYAGFGGFPHRVGDEVGPGLVGLSSMIAAGRLLDYHRAAILTTLLLPTLLLVRHRALSWLWSAALLYASLLALGPHLVTPDDLFPAVRFLGPLQIVVSLAIGAGAVQLATTLWQLAARSKTPLVGRTVIASVAVAATIFVIVPAAAYNHSRVRISTDYPKVHRNEYDAIFSALLKEPPGRKQSRDGGDTHWLNLLPYVYERRDALWQMGGAGLQSSPNYEFLWDERDPIRTAWIFDAPILLFGREHETAMPEGQTIVETQHFIMRRLPSEGLVSPVQVLGVLPPGRFPARAAAKSWLATQAPMKDQVFAYAGFGGAGDMPNG